MTGKTPIAICLEFVPIDGCIKTYIHANLSAKYKRGLHLPPMTFIVIM